MTDAGLSTCSVCGAQAEEEIPVAGVGEVCASCLLAGRFFGASSTLRLSVAAERLQEMCHSAANELEGEVREPEELARRRDYDGARNHYVGLARRFTREGKPLLAAHVLYRALRLPGQSAEVYQGLGLAAHAMDCEKEAVQHFKTAGWLALKSRNAVLLRDVLSELERLVPRDPWLAKAQSEMDASSNEPVKRCRFCGRTALEAGPLIEGTEASVCSTCVKNMMNLDGQSDRRS